MVDLNASSWCLIYSKADVFNNKVSTLVRLKNNEAEKPISSKSACQDVQDIQCCLQFPNLYKLGVKDIYNALLDYGSSA
jgi:hypothetical protein